MKISSNYQYYPQFKSNNHLANLTKKIPNTNICKNMTYLDKNCLISYLHASKYRLRNCGEEIKNIFKLDGEDFLSSAYEFLCNKLEIPEVLRPQIENYVNQEPYPLAYLPSFNTIFKNPDLSMYTKSQQFGFLRHELQHLKQNLHVLRHETLGPIAVEFFTDNRTQAIKRAIQYHLQNGIGAEELAALVGGGEEIKKMFLELHKNYHEGDDEAFERTFSAFKAPLREELSTFRKQAVDALGEIKEGTRDADLAEIFFEDFKNVNYYNPDGQVDLGRYMTTSIENDALLAGDIAGFDAAGGGCFYKVLKDNALRTLANTESEDYKSIKRAVDEIFEKRAQ